VTYDQGYRCQWCEQPCGIEENQRGSCDECSHAWDSFVPGASYWLDAPRDQSERVAMRLLKSTARVAARPVQVVKGWAA
jgi:hypothetical protein